MPVQDLQVYLKQIEEYHGDKVRVLIRYSGTEPKIRILVEAENEQIMNEVFNNVKVLVSHHI